MEYLRRFAEEPHDVQGRRGTKSNIEKLIPRLQDYRFGTNYSKFIGEILSDKYENHDMSYSVSKSLLNQSDKNVICFSCSSENASLLTSYFCEKCRTPSSEINQRILQNGLYLLELFFMIFQSKYNIQRRGRRLLFNQLINNLKDLRNENFHSFAIDDIIEECKPNKAETPIFLG